MQSSTFPLIPSASESRSSFVKKVKESREKEKGTKRKLITSNLRNHTSTTAKIQRVHATNPFAPRTTKEKIKMQTHQPKRKEKEEKKEKKEEKHITHVKGRIERGKKT